MTSAALQTCEGVDLETACAGTQWLLNKKPHDPTATENMKLITREISRRTDAGSWPPHRPLGILWIGLWLVLGCLAGCVSQPAPVTAQAGDITACPIDHCGSIIAGRELLRSPVRDQHGRYTAQMREFWLVTRLCPNGHTWTLANPTNATRAAVQLPPIPNHP